MLGTVKTVAICGLLTGTITKPAKACDRIRPIVVDENGNHIVEYCFTTPDPEPPNDREGSGEMTFEYIKEWCEVNGNYSVDNSRACSFKQYDTIRDTWINKGGVIR